MTSDIDIIKTNEFLRRRKLRLQQVREQSKDIAKKIRQRAKIEKLRHVVQVDSKKESEYFDCQEKLVKRLENLYAQGLQNVGSGHKKALEETHQDIEEKIDQSKSRGREAFAELRKRKQNKLDEQKKILDRKLLAREVANEISREKSNNTKNLLTKSSKTSVNEKKNSLSNTEINQVQALPVPNNIDNSDAPKNDMGTQWESVELPNEWEHVPALSLPKDDSVKDLVNDKSDKSKRINLFALSDEMPSSLRGGLTSVTEESAPLKPSLTLVSDYLQNRNLRLREPEPSSSKKSTEDLRSIRQTILRTRATKTDGSVLNTVCHVLDEQIIPVPSWQAGDNYIFNPSKHDQIRFKSSKTPNVNLPTSPRSLYRRLKLNPHCLGSTKLTKDCQRTFKPSVSGVKDKSSQSTEPEISLLRKKSISVYNHNTRDLHDIPCNDEGMVMRTKRTDDDAYAQAYKETAIINSMEKEQIIKKQRDMRNKVAVTRQNVDKEYQDTLAFLNSLPKDTGAKVIKTAYMDDEQQQLQKNKHQRKMQQEFKRIEKECYKHSCKHSKRKATVSNHRSKSKSPVFGTVRQDFEYSWMPVPESDGNLAIHTIPTKNKSGNTVKFGQDSYHEYRSRHKHTPPTKDYDKNRVVETVIVENNSSDGSSITSETSSIEDLSLEKTKEDSRLKDAERIIIYKILESKKDKRKHKKSEVKNKSVIDEDIRLNKKDDNKHKNIQSVEKTAVNVQSGVSFEELHEGVYKAVNQNGQSYNITSCYTANVEMWQTSTERKPWWDNITSMYYSDDKKDGNVSNRSIQKNKINQTCLTKHSHITQHDEGFQKDGGDNQNGAENRRLCKCDHNISKDSGLVQPSAATSTSSFKTASNDKSNRYVPESGFLKFMDEGGQETGKFYIGASGFIKDDDYEVVIQLRKKEGEKLKNISDIINKEIKETLNNASKTTMSENTEPNKVTEDEKTFNVSNDLAKDKSVSPIKKRQESNEQKELQKNQKETDETSPSTNMAPSTCEKAVHTSFKNTYPDPDNVPKIDPVSRPATSTYTQTSFNSSMPRPVFMHMSSSTSTAYMSPPEFVLPKFLRQDHVLSYEDTYDSEITTNHQQCVKKQNCKNEQCTCKRCLCNNSENFEFDYSKRNKMKTPPNTARSDYKCDNASETSYRELKKSKCHKCVSRKNSSSKHSVCHKSHTHKSINTFKRRSLKNLPRADHKSSTTQTPQQKLFNLKSNSKISNIKLNPTVKKYVNELLSLNKEGLKAVDIINQDCSNVTTPGSSIINVTCNAATDSTLENKISLEDFKNMLKQRILKDISNHDLVTKTNHIKNTESQTDKVFKLPKKKSVHKVKSLNISKRLQKKNKLISNERLKIKTPISSSSSIREMPPDKGIVRSRSKSSPTPRPVENSEYSNNTSSDVCDTTGPRQPKGFKQKIINRQSNYQSSACMALDSRFKQRNKYTMPIHRATTTSMSSDSGLTSFLLKNVNQSKLPTNTCTQTNEIIDAETNFMKLAENKIQNMEKIADLTEKCTKRLSNLAKVLEEVRRNKSSVYNQISTSDSASESDNRNGKGQTGHISVSLSDPILVENKTTLASSNSPIAPTKLDDKQLGENETVQFPSFLKDIPKPEFFKSASNTSLSVISEKSDQSTQIPHTPTEQVTVKYRGRPPPALTRINLKNGQDTLIIPHELSTVVEVDSPMSVKIKNQISHDAQLDISDKLNEITDLPQENVNTATDLSSMREMQINPDILQSNLNLSKRHSKIPSTDSSDDSKMRMMDMKQFNDIMLKPFISLQEYAKQCNIGLDDGSNAEDILKDDQRNDELSSLHSDGSLPDVIAELLKRKIISAPFEFDSASNVNSTTMSSESAISMLALSKVRKEKKKSMLIKSKENIIETSETLSISSNPDLEKAFQKLGMGWASSTLKKTKERLALSSSSSASSSSMSQFKIKSFSQNVPNLGTDSTSSLIDMSHKHERKKSSPSKHPVDNAKNAIQQTSLTNSMTVKEFLTNELAKKITFNNNKSRKEAEEKFVSLYETKMPEEMKNSQVREEDESSVTSANNNRARTSTPVQIFKSATYRSTSSSNTSNGLFSNADDLSSVKGTSNSLRNHSTSDKDDLTIPNCSLKTKKDLSDCSKSD